MQRATCTVSGDNSPSRLRLLLLLLLLFLLLLLLPLLLLLLLLLSLSLPLSVHISEQMEHQGIARSFQTDNYSSFDGKKTHPQLSRVRMQIDVVVQRLLSSVVIGDASRCEYGRMLRFVRVAIKSVQIFATRV